MQYKYKVDFWNQSSSDNSTIQEISLQDDHCDGLACRVSWAHSIFNSLKYCNEESNVNSNYESNIEALRTETGDLSEEIHETMDETHKHTIATHVVEHAATLKGPVYQNEDRFICSGLIENLSLNDNCSQEHPPSLHLKCYAVIDGHGGAACADFLKNSLLETVAEEWKAYGDRNVLPVSLVKVLETSMLSLERKYTELAQLNSDGSGACIVVALLLGDWLCVSNIGDAAAVLFDWQGQQIKMSEIHSTDNRNECTRVQNAGGKINKNGYIEGSLIPSRTIGDWTFKSKHPDLIISAPDTFVINILAAKQKFMPTSY